MKRRVGSLRSAVGNGKWIPPILLAILCLLLPTSHFQLPTASATPTPEDVLRSFNQSMDQEPDYSKLLPWLLLFAAATVAVVVFRQRQKRQAVPRALNHPGKLIREVVKMAEIDPVQMKELKALAQEHGCDSPLTLLLCPSLMGKASTEPDHSTTESPGS
jgi:hypothetical protein